MFDFLKNLTKSEEEKQQEAFSAYLDDLLSPSQRLDFETLLAQDAGLRAELARAQLLRQQMRQMPRRSLPRSFTLDAALYGVPKRERLGQAYPFLRVATAMAALFFVLALGLTVFTNQSGDDMASMASAPVMEAPLAEAEIAAFAVPPEEGAAAKMAETAVPVEVEMTEAVSTEIMVQAEAADMADGEPMGGASESALAAPAVAATVSGLPRPTETESAVARLAEPTLSAQEGVANEVDLETAVTPQSSPEPLRQTRPLFTNLEWLLIALGLLLAILIVVTLLARRKLGHRA